MYGSLSIPLQRVCSCQELVVGHETRRLFRRLGAPRPAHAEWRLVECDCDHFASARAGWSFAKRPRYCVAQWQNPSMDDSVFVVNFRRLHIVGITRILRMSLAGCCLRLCFTLTYLQVARVASSNCWSGVTLLWLFRWSSCASLVKDCFATRPCFFAKIDLREKREDHAANKAF
jgi:hypothetical protein